LPSRRAPQEGKMALDLVTDDDIRVLLDNPPAPQVV
jgi:hypothetical protein